MPRGVYDRSQKVQALQKKMRKLRVEKRKAAKQKQSSSVKPVPDVEQNARDAAHFRLVELIDELVQSARVHEMAGGGDPLEFELKEKEYGLAHLRVVTHIAQMRRDFE